MFATISIAFWMSALSVNSKRKGIIYSIFSGIIAFIAAFCKITFVGMIAIPFITILFALSRKNEERNYIWRLTVTFSAAFIIGIVSFFLWLHSFNLFSGFYKSWAIIREHPLYSSILQGLVGRDSYYILKASMPAFFCVILAMALAFWTQRKWSIFKICFQLVIFLLFTRLLLRFSSRPLYFISAYIYILVIIGIIAVWTSTDWFGDRKKESFPIITLLLGSIFLQWLSSACSGNGVFSSTFGMVFSLPLAVAISYNLPNLLKNRFKPKSLSARPSQVVVIGLAIIIGAYGLHYKWWHPYRDSVPRFRLNTPFKSPKLRGIFSTPEHVEEIDKLVSSVSQFVKKGDYILVYQNLPMLYFLTGTRPTTKITWLSDPGSPPSLIKELVEDMKREYKPKIVIRAKYFMSSPNWPEKNMVMHYEIEELPSEFKLRLYEPKILGSRLYHLNQFVEANYKFVKTVGSFEILLPKEYETF